MIDANHRPRQDRDPHADARVDEKAGPAGGGHTSHPRRRRRSRRRRRRTPPCAATAVATLYSRRSTERPTGFAPSAPPRVRGWARSGRSDSGLMPGAYISSTGRPPLPHPPRTRSASTDRSTERPSGRREDRPRSAAPPSACRYWSCRAERVRGAEQLRTSRRAAVGASRASRPSSPSSSPASRPGGASGYGTRERALARPQARAEREARVEHVAQAEVEAAAAHRERPAEVVRLLAAEARQAPVRRDPERPRPRELQRRLGPVLLPAQRAADGHARCRRRSSSAGAGAARRG